MAPLVGVDCPMKTAHGKIIQHEEGLGLPDPEMVQRRALEIAHIDGRKQFNQADWQQAKLELHGHVEPEADDPLEAVTVPDEIAGSTGHKIEERPPAEEPENIQAELFSEGMDEAVHDQMLQSSNQEDNEE